MRILASAILVVVGAASCANADYVAADKATYDAVAPEHKKYVEADPALTKEQKERRIRTLDTWRLRIEKSQ